MLMMQKILDDMLDERKRDGIFFQVADSLQLKKMIRCSQILATSQETLGLELSSLEWTHLVIWVLIILHGLLFL